MVAGFALLPADLPHDFHTKRRILCQLSKALYQAGGGPATVIEERDRVSAWAKAQQQAHEDVVIEEEPPTITVIPIDTPSEETK